MTHSGGQPHRVGDRGQRYRITGFGWPRKDEAEVIGWCQTEENAQNWAKRTLTAPGCKWVEVYDRITGDTERLDK